MNRWRSLASALNQSKATCRALPDHHDEFVVGTEADGGDRGGPIFPDSLRRWCRRWKDETL